MLCVRRVVLRFGVIKDDVMIMMLNDVIVVVLEHVRPASSKVPEFRPVFKVVETIVAFLTMLGNHKKKTG